MTHLSSHLHTSQLVAMTLLWQKKRNMAIYSLRPWASDWKSVLCDSSVCTSVLWDMFPLFWFSFPSVCFYWVSLPLDVMWMHSIAETRLLMHSGFVLSCLRWDVVSLFVSDSSTGARGDSVINRIRKRIFNILTFPPFLFFLPMKIFLSV